MKKGHIEQRGKNRYRFKYQSNNVIYKDTFTAKDIEEAERKLGIWIKEIERGELIYSEYTVNEFAQIWLDRQVKPNSSGSRTPNKYLIFLENWFLPEYGEKYINKITKEDMTCYFNWLKTQKTKYSNRKEKHILSYETIRKYKAILHAMFQTALEWKKISENPCSIRIRFNTNGSSLISRKDPRVDYYRYKEYIHILDILKKEKEIILEKDISKKEKLKYYARLVLIELALKTGLRRSELFGLTIGVRDIDLEDRMLDVNKTRQYSKNAGKETLITKSKYSNRKISIPKSIIPTLSILIEMLPKKQIYLFENLSIDGICSWFKKFQLNNGIRIVRFHDLRHTHASILLYKGVDIKTISDRLGHADISTTIKIYLHVIRELNQRVSEIIDEL